MEQLKNGVMPSTREVQRFFGFASQTAAMDLLRALERKGAIRRLPGKARAVILSHDGDEAAEDLPETLSVPFYGSIAAGMPQQSDSGSEGCLMVDMNALGIPRHGRTFALKVRGDSMIDAHIMEGDFVVLEFRDPRPGDVVAALIDGECTLKRYIISNGKPHLKAENRAYPNLIPATELVIQGVMIALLRKNAGREAA